MENGKLLLSAQAMVQQALNTNQIPIVFLMNAITRDVIGDTIKANFKPTWWSEFKRKLLRRPHGALTVLHGVPLVVNQYMPPGMMSLQLAPTMMPGPQPQAQEQRENPFVKREPVKAAADDAVTLDDLSKGNGATPSVTDVFIKGMEQVDDLKHVVVIRVHHNEDVDLSMSCDQYQAVGIVQKAQYWLATRG